MGCDDLGMVQHADMFWNRKVNPIVRRAAPVLFRFAKEDQFTPDRCVEDGDTLSPYGLNATILHIPGHSRGSIAVLTEAGDLFCGDLFENTRAPRLNSLMDDTEAAAASVVKLERLDVQTVYPGHGHPFPIAALNRSSP
jgi:hydroxyacylglutathione hydrolase